MSVTLIVVWAVKCPGIWEKFEEGKGEGRKNDVIQKGNDLGSCQRS